MNGFSGDEEGHARELESFWSLYQHVLPTHPVFERHRGRLGQVIPMYYHGDEGRGKLRRPVLITSFVSGLTAEGHSFLSRFLAIVFPGERYAVGTDGSETLESLHQELAKDLNKLFEDGFDVHISGLP